MSFSRTKFNRRRFCAMTGGAVASVALGSACSRFGNSSMFSDGRLSARPGAGVKTSATGQVMLGITSERDAVLRLPPGANAGSPLPLLVMLHGATQGAENMFWYLGDSYNEAGVAVLAPNSRDTTWDAIGSVFGRGSFGKDVELLNLALARVFALVAIDPYRIAIGGFSDGASYAISLGLINGDLFSRVVAFSPGFLIEGSQRGEPRFFISHGTHDHILPIDRCGRPIAANLTARGYNVTFREFDGDHEIPGDVAREGLQFVSSKG
jgi:phospholipase/carboxylesterase